MSMRGTLKKFFAEKGIGYIAPDDGSEDVFIHFQSLINGGEADMIPGAKLSYDLEINDRNGKTKAVRVKVESPGDPSYSWKGGGGGGGKGGYGKAPAGRSHGTGPYGQSYGGGMGGGGYEGGDAAYWQQLMATITQAAQAMQGGGYQGGGGGMEPGSELGGAKNLETALGRTKAGLTISRHSCLNA
eukprot:CAMPEP_0181485970 /NCGR_PEP_ID=MMETSP1110-20121109/46860_1 /TAXON_ID=174948 /ORGANISM="Symbiodinium sp., Strain CCMP421" /LENGTH=185 /DNA_ID=CAMNT_0023612027 /DNA_START=77 /DNA_END=631 /DNA_ORIENTATION=-